MIELEINGKKISAAPGTTVLEAAKSAGIKIPTLCHWDGIKPYGACRVCTVEITDNGRTTYQASCCYEVKNGLKVRTDSPAVEKGRKVLLQLLLARCPDAPEIRKLAAEWGVKETPFAKKNEKCILCGLCVRACASLLGAEAIGFSGRGISRKVGTPFGIASETCIACGACTYVCPTNHMQMESTMAASLRKKAGYERKCRYALMGMVAGKLCPNNYECATCTFDQTMESHFGKHPAFIIASTKQAHIAQ
jgi:predicted molibdopterin-dependent oxidoreductase YjgC